MKFKYQHYIFDFDGTLANTSEGIYDAYRYTFEQIGKPITDPCVLDGVIGAPLLDNFIRRFGLSESDAKEAILIYRKRYAQVGVRMVRVYPGIEELLCYLQKEGHRISIATLKRTDLAYDILRRQCLLQYFNDIIGIDDQDSLTKTDLIRLCMRFASCLPCNTILIGDSLIDFESAKECGIGFLGAGYGLGNISNYGTECNDKDKGYWGTVNASVSLIKRLEEISKTDDNIIDIPRMYRCKSVCCPVDGTGELK